MAARRMDAVVRVCRVAIDKTGDLSMAYLWFFGCFINQHQPLRRGVKWDGLTYVATCRHCGKPIARISPRNWQLQKTDGEADGA